MMVFVVVVVAGWLQDALTAATKFALMSVRRLRGERGE